MIQDEKCEASPTGEHEADAYSFQQDADCPAFVVNVSCKHCGCSGSATIDPKTIQW